MIKFHTHQIRKRPFIVAILLYFLLSTAFAGSGRLTNVATTAAPFLEVGVGSRAIGMGGAFVAVANDVSALYWNPAGLCRVDKSEAVFERIEWLADISFNYIGATLSIGSFGSAGFFLNAMSVPKMEVRTVDYPGGTGEEYDASSIAMGLSYSYALTDRFSIGFNGKYISERIWHEKTSTFAVDIGTLYYTGFKSLRIGAAITNFGPSMQMEGSDLIIYYDADPSIDGNNDRIMGTLMTDEWPLPLNMQFGIAYDLVDRSNARFTVALDAFHPINNTESVNIGCELSLLNMLYARAGYKALGQQDSEEGLTLGLGLKYKMFGQSNIKFDYAYADFGLLEYVNRYTLRLDF
ncbi:MAG: PorV/PorQ family protein [Candidatus Marinimicrobia bacterium]|nr:PorV/PorQ family protein [Candidatus Neomarinimicrobiota bacterium]